MQSWIVFFEDEVVLSIKDYAKIRRLRLVDAINELILKGYREACKEVKKGSLGVDMQLSAEKRGGERW